MSSTQNGCPESTSTHDTSSTSEFSNFPPSFYDNLTTIHLTTRALRELSRRNRLLPRPRSESLHSLYSGDIKRVSRHGGPDLTDIRGVSVLRCAIYHIENTPLTVYYQFPAPAGFLDSITMSSNGSSNDTKGVPRKRQRSPSSSDATSRKKRTSAYDNNFEEVMRKCGVYMTPYDVSDGRGIPEPKNLEAMETALSRRRSSLSSDDLESMFRDFRRYSTKRSESRWKRTALPLMAGNKPGFDTDSDVIFANLDPLTEWDTTVRLKPDLYDGVALDQVNPTVRRRLRKVIVPTRNDCQVVCPNFFMEVKRPEGFPAVLRRQVMHAGAIGARAMHSLRNYGRRVPKYDNKAYTISVMYQDGRLMFFAHHITPGVEEGPPEYFMNPIMGFEMEFRNQFASGVMALRNARDWAKSTRDQLVAKANERASCSTAIDNPIVTTLANNTDTELADDDAHISQPNLVKKCDANQEIEGIRVGF